MRIHIAIDGSDALLHPPCRLDRTTPLDLLQHRKQQRFVDDVHRHCAQMREDVPFKAGDHVIGVNWLPLRLLDRVPFTSGLLECLEGPAVAHQLRTLGSNAGITALPQQLAGIVALLPCLGERDLGIDAEREQLFLALQPVLEAP